MKEYSPLVLCICVLALISGCASMPLTEDGLVVAKDTTAGIEDLGVARITKGF